MSHDARINSGGENEGAFDRAVNERLNETADRVATEIDVQQLRVSLASVISKQELDSIIGRLAYTVNGLRMLREGMPAEGLEHGRILDFAAAILVDSWENDREKAGKMATLLSQTWVGWHPEDVTIIHELLRLCLETIERGDTAMVAVVQPTIFVLYNLGYKKEYAQWLETTTYKREWRQADLDRNVTGYYASGQEPSYEDQLKATVRHLTDPNRANRPTRAHDVGLLVEICERLRDAGREGSDPEMQRTRELLKQTIIALEEHGLTQIAAYAQKHLR